MSRTFPFAAIARESEKKANIVTTDCTNCNAVEMLEVLAVFPLVQPENIDQQLTFYLLTRATTPSLTTSQFFQHKFRKTQFSNFTHDLCAVARRVAAESFPTCQRASPEMNCHHFAGGYWLALPSFTFTPDRSLIKTSKWNIQRKWEEKVLRSLPVFPRSAMHFVP